MLELLDHSANTTLLTPIRALELRLLVENIRPTSVKDTIPDVAPFTGVPLHTQGPSNDTNAVRDPLTASTETTTPDDPPTPADVDAVTAESDVHTDASHAVPATRTRALYTTPPSPLPTTLMLALPVAAMFDAAADDTSGAS